MEPLAILVTIMVATAAPGIPAKSFPPKLIPRAMPVAECERIAPRFAAAAERDLLRETGRTVRISTACVTMDTPEEAVSLFNSLAKALGSK